MRKVLEKIIPHENFEKAVVFLKVSKRTILALLTASIFVDIFFVKTSSDIVIFGTLLLYGIFIKILRLSSKLTFSLCLGLITTMSVDYLFVGVSVSTEKAAVWFVLFMALGIFQQWRESTG